MKWIKASERLPDKKNVLEVIVFRNIKSKSQLIPLCFEITPNIPALLNDVSKWEWLDESPLPSYTGKSAGITVRKFMLKKFPPRDYMDCPVPTHHWETIQEYAEAYHASLSSYRTEQPVGLTDEEFDIIYNDFCNYYQDDNDSKVFRDKCKGWVNRLIKNKNYLTDMPQHIQDKVKKNQEQRKEIKSMFPIKATHKVFGEIDIIGVRVECESNNNLMYQLRSDGQYYWIYDYETVIL